jgi:hypothetical protein
LTVGTTLIIPNLSDVTEFIQLSISKKLSNKLKYRNVPESDEMVHKVKKEMEALCL